MSCGSDGVVYVMNAKRKENDNDNYRKIYKMMGHSGGINSV